MVNSPSPEVSQLQRCISKGLSSKSSQQGMEAGVCYGHQGLWPLKEGWRFDPLQKSPKKAKSIKEMWVLNPGHMRSPMQQNQENLTSNRDFHSTSHCSVLGTWVKIFLGREGGWTGCLARHIPESTSRTETIFKKDASLADRSGIPQTRP